PGGPPAKPGSEMAGGDCIRSHGARTPGYWWPDRPPLLRYSIRRNRPRSCAGDRTRLQGNSHPFTRAQSGPNERRPGRTVSSPLRSAAAVDQVQNSAQGNPNPRRTVVELVTQFIKCFIEQKGL